MADTDAQPPNAQPMSESDISANPDLTPAAPLKGETTDEGGTLSGKTADAKQAIKEGASKYGAQAADKARAFAEDGKARAGSALDQLSQLLTDAAGQVDEKLGAQYGGYARTAASSVSSFSDQIKAKDMDELVDNARELVRKSPAVAIGAAAAVGFVIARLFQSGIDSNKA